MSTIAARRGALASIPVLLLAVRPAAAQLQPRDGRAWAVAAIALVGTAAADQRLADALRGPGPPLLRSTAAVAEPLGRARIGLLGLGASYVTARLAHDPAWARATVRAAAGYVAADAVTAVLKPAVDRARPQAGLGPYELHDHRAGEHRHSFPSGHATHAFALAAGIAEEAHRPWVTGVAYGTATLVAWSRVHDEAHWPSDVVAGALVGTSASLTTVAWLHRREQHHERRRAERGMPRADDARPAARAAEPHVWVGPGTITLSVRF
jgi:membrane-associated phospholipid phosphatase